MAISNYNPWRTLSEEDVVVTLPEDEYQKQVDEENARIANVNINIGENERAIHIQKEEVLAYTEKVYKQAKYAAGLMKTHGVGTEGLYTASRNAILGLTNSVIMVGALVSTGILHGWRDFKRSELTEYIHSNRATVPLLYRVSMEDIGDTNMPIPQGMKTMYLEVVNFLIDYLKKADMKRTTRGMRDIAEGILKDVKKGTDIFSSDTKGKIQALKLKDLETHFKKSWKFFEADSKSFVEKPFRECFKTTADFKSSVVNAQDMDDDLRQVASIHDVVADIESTYKVIVNHQDTIDPKKLDDLADLTREFAICISNYATVINDVNRVQHNLMHCLMYVRRHTGY